MSTFDWATAMAPAQLPSLASALLGGALVGAFYLFRFNHGHNPLPLTLWLAGTGFSVVLTVIGMLTLDPDWERGVGRVIAWTVFCFGMWVGRGLRYRVEDVRIRHIRERLE